MNREKEELPVSETHYLPPMLVNGRVQSAVLVCEGKVVEIEESVPLKQVEIGRNRACKGRTR